MIRFDVPLLVRLASWSAVALFAVAGRADDASPRSPVDPHESLKLLRIDPGLRAELAACEPQIVDPVTVRFDARGRMWVAEYRDYPNGPSPGGKPLSRIKLLEDTDGDGFFETAHTFADDLPFCNGLQPWRDGVIATMAGRIAFLNDADGDRRADRVETWFTGFAEENPQLRVNHPRFGLDNHVYVANGLRGGSAANPRAPEAPAVSLRGHDLKFDPRSGAFEAIAGNGQFGLTFDDAGNRFLCSNRNPCYHVVFEDRYLARNPNYAVAAVVNDVAAAGEASRVFPIVRAWTTSILHAGQFTAACGLDIYRGDALPKGYYGNVFTCEPTGSLVHREIVTPSGATFSGRSPYEGREFLASSDPWFRPVFCEGGPDGALYVCDMYRAVIEHPQFMPEELKNRPDLRHGDDRGRIYRIVPDDFRRPVERPHLQDATTEQLVESLEHRNAWWRETAQRLLVERGDASAAKPLDALVRNGRTPQAKVQALATLAGLKALTNDLLATALQDADAHVLEQAVLLAESRLDDPTLAKLVVAVARRAAGRVRFQAVLTLQTTDSADKVRALADAAAAEDGDAWLRRAVLLSAGNDAAEVLADLVRREVPTDAEALAARREMIRELAGLAAAQADRKPLRAVVAELRASAAAARRAAYEPALLNGAAKVLKDRLAEVADDGWIAAAAQVAASTDARASRRAEACDLLAFAPLAQALPTLQPLLSDADGEIRARALAALAAHRDPQVGELLLGSFAAQSPKLRGQILDALLARPERVKLLLDAMERGTLKPRELDQARATRLLKTTDSAIKARAEKLLASAMPADRTKALEDYRRVLTLTADPRRGREVFKKNCASCHKVGDVGIEVGPSIADLRTKTPEQVLVDVIQPNKAIDNNFVSYTLVTSDGLQYVGILGAETPGSVTLKLPDGKTVSVLKKDIDELTSNGVSLMPEGVERQIPHQDMADVISFVKNWRYLDGAVPGAPGAPPGGK